MKYSFLAIVSVLFAGSVFGQTNFSGTIEKSSGGELTIYVKPASSKTGKVSGITFTLAIPTSVGARPTLALDNSPAPAVSYTIQNAVNQSISGTAHYIYNVLGTGDVSATGSAKTFTANVDNALLKATFSGAGGTALVKLVNLPEGGTDANANAFFAVSIDGIDVVNEAAMFYSIPSFSTFQNNLTAGGYSGLSYAQTTGGIPLPVKFTSFSAVKRDDNAILNWSAENETVVTDRYEVERSLNAVDFTSIATIASKNNGNSSNSYALTDARISTVRTAGAIYYRVKQIDKDGKYVYTEIRSVRLDKSAAIAVYPNPVKNITSLTIDLAEADPVKISINDAAGKEMQTIALQGNKGMNIKTIDLSSFAAGTYRLTINTGAEVKTITVVKAQ